MIDFDNPKLVQSRHYRKGRIKPVQLIVVHSAETFEKGDTAENVAQYFASTSRIASAHYCVDRDSVVQCVWDKDTAYHCKNANGNGVGIEHAGRAKQTREEWLDAYGIDMLNLSAQLGAYLCRKFSIEPVRAQFASDVDPTVIRAGFTGHADVPGHGHHWDPGPGWPWDYYLARVAHYLTVGAQE